MIHFRHLGHLQQIKTSLKISGIIKRIIFDQVIILKLLPQQIMSNMEQHLNRLLFVDILVTSVSDLLQDHYNFTG